jgi:hypothetical protein
MDDVSLQNPFANIFLFDLGQLAAVDLKVLPIA